MNMFLEEIRHHEDAVARAEKWVGQFGLDMANGHRDTSAVLTIHTKISPLLSTGHRDTNGWIDYSILPHIQAVVERRLPELFREALEDMKKETAARQARMVEDSIELIRQKKPEVLS